MLSVAIRRLIGDFSNSDMWLNGVTLCDFYIGQGHADRRTWGRVISLRRFAIAGTCDAYFFCISYHYFVLILRIEEMNHETPDTEIELILDNFVVPRVDTLLVPSALHANGLADYVNLEILSFSNCQMTSLNGMPEFPMLHTVSLLIVIECQF